MTSGQLSHSAASYLQKMTLSVGMQAEPNISGKKSMQVLAACCSCHKTLAHIASKSIKNFYMHIIWEVLAGDKLLDAEVLPLDPEAGGNRYLVKDQRPRVSGANCNGRVPVQAR